jgi:PAS domain S-box-containing protein
MMRQPRQWPPARQVRAVLDAVPDALVMVNDEGRITLVNLQTARLFGYAAADLLGQPVEVLVPERFRGGHPAHRARYVAAPRVRPMGEGLALFGRRKDGSEFPVEISLSPLRTEHGSVVIGAIRDVSDRRRAEAEIERMKQDLTNMVVHDLKNPLNGIAMMVQLALRKGGAALPATQQNYLLQIDRSCREMMRLVLNLLEVSKIEEGKMPVMREPVVLAAVVEEVVDEYGPVAEQCGRRLVVAVGRDLPEALGDRALLKRVLVNLVVNALRHSGSHEVRLEGVRGPGSAEVTLSVLDRGHGIPEEEQGHVFEKFRTVRGDPSADTGLGLPFCKLAVERMDGRIALASTPGETTAFSITLPTPR